MIPGSPASDVVAPPSSCKTVLYRYRQTHSEITEGPTIRIGAWSPRERLGGGRLVGVSDAKPAKGLTILNTGIAGGAALAGGTWPWVLR